MMSRLYWVGLYEDSNRFKWFFQVDLTPAILPAIGYFAKCVVAGGKHTLILLVVWCWVLTDIQFYGPCPVTSPYHSPRRFPSWLHQPVTPWPYDTPASRTTFFAPLSWLTSSLVSVWGISGLELADLYVCVIASDVDVT